MAEVRAAPGPQRLNTCSLVRNDACLILGNVFTPNRNITVAGPQINSVFQGVHNFRIVVGNSYQIYVVVAIFYPFCTDGYLFICVGDSSFLRGG